MLHRAFILTLIGLSPTFAAADEFTGKAFQTPEGIDVRPADVDARLLVVDVWATWCGPCAQALPHLDAIAREGAARGVAVLAISQDEDTSKVAAFAKSLGVSKVRVLLDPKHLAAEALEPETMPATFIIEPTTGRVLAKINGYHPGDAAKLRTLVGQLLGDMDKADARRAATSAPTMDPIGG